MSGAKWNPGSGPNTPQPAGLSWEGIFQAIGHPTLILDPDHTVLAANRAALRATGLSSEGIRGKKCYEVFHGTDAPPSGCPLQRMLRSGELEAEDMEAEALGRTFMVSCTPVRDAQGQLLSVIHIAADITERGRAEEALRQARDFAENLLQTTNALFVQLNIQGEVVRINEAAERTTGYRQAELEGRNWFETLVPRDRYPYVWEEFVRITERNGFPRVFENPILAKSGQEHYIIWQNSMLREDGAIVGTISFGIDITERKRAEEALRESEERFRDLHENAPNAYFSIGVDGLIRRCNRRAGELLGYAAEELAGRPVMEMYTDTPHGKEKAAKVLQRFRAGETVRDQELQMQKADGTPVWISLTVNAVWDAQGRIVESRSVVVDITDRKRAEEALREKTEELERYFTNSLDLICIADTQGYFRRLNPEWEKTLGYSLSELWGKRFLDFVHPDDLSSTLSSIAELSEQREVLGFVNRYRHKDGSYRWIEWRSYPAGDLIYAAARDITDRKRAEEALREREAHYRSLFEDSPISLWEVDFSDVKAYLDGLRQSGVKDFRPYFESHPEDVARCATMVKVIDVNRATLELYQARDRQEFLAGLGTVFGEESYAAFGEELIAIAEGKTMFSIEAITRTLTGEKNPIVLAWSVAPGSEQTLAKVIVSIIDITERKQAEEVIQRRSKDLAALVKVSQTLATTLDTETVLQMIVESATHLVGLDSGAIYLLEGEELHLGATTPPLPPQFPEPLRRAPLDDHPHIRQSVSTGLPVILPDTATADLSPAERAISEARGLRSILYLPLLIEKRAVGTLILGTVGATRSFSKAEIDVYRTLSSQAALTVENARLYKQVQSYVGELEQRVAERTAELRRAMGRAQDADRLKSVFLATMSHELRTPLNSILGFTGVLLQGLAGPLSAEQDKQLGMVQASARHLLGLINDILDLSKIEAGEMEVATDRFDLRRAIEHALETVRPLAEKKGLTLRLDIGPAVGDFVGDRRKIEQVLLNLLTNAIKFTDQGSVCLTSRIADRRVVTTISDTGIGIRPEDMPHLFQAFRQAEHGPARRHEGTGLGLAIAKRLVEMMGGKIWAESGGPGAGSTFTFTLPVVSPERTEGEGT